MVDVALEVDDCRSLLQDSLVEAFLYAVGNCLLVSVALTDIHVVPDTDDVSHEGDHVCCLSHSLAMCNLALLLVQVLDLQSKKVTCRCEGESCSCGVIAEDGDTKA